MADKKLSSLSALARLDFSNSVDFRLASSGLVFEIEGVTRIDAAKTFFVDYSTPMPDVHIALPATGRRQTVALGRLSSGVYRVLLRDAEGLTGEYVFTVAPEWEGRRLPFESNLF